MEPPTWRDAGPPPAAGETSRSAASLAIAQELASARGRPRVSAYGGGVTARTSSSGSRSSEEKRFEIEPGNWCALEEEELNLFEQSERQTREPGQDAESRPLTETNYSAGNSQGDQRAQHGQRFVVTTTTATTTTATSGGVRANASSDKLAPAKGDNRATIELARATGVSGGGGGYSATSGKIEKETQPEVQAVAAATNPKRGGLLEALLGNRGKSWREHKTVILEIQNGGVKGKKLQASTPDKSGDNEATNHKQQQQQQQRETFSKLEESSDTREAEAASGRIKASQQQQQPRNKLPTFGSVPQRLTRLPYFTYHVTASQRAGDRAAASERQQTPQDKYARRAGSVASFGSRTSSQASAASTATATGVASGSSPAGSRTQRRASQLGFSNISNLFPGSEPASRQSAANGRRHWQTSPLPAVSAPSQRVHSRADGAVRDKATTSPLDVRATRAQRAQGPQQQQALPSERRRSHFSALSPMTRRNSFSSLQQQQQQKQQQQTYRAASGSQQSLTQHEQLQQQRHQMATLRRQQVGGGTRQAPVGARGRPVSATGSYIGAGGASYRQRSPSASSLHYLQQHGSSYRLGSAGMSPLVDPDCPVHGDSPEAGGGGPLPPRGRDYGSAGRRSLQQQQQQSIYSASSQPDLLYGGGGGAHREQADFYAGDPYNSRASYAHQGPIYDSAGPPQKSPLAAAGGGEYSPVSPTGAGHSWARYAATPGKPPPVARQEPAYYDGASRFSLYHPASGETGTGGVRTSLAPPSEQLRRILGYRPASAQARPVHLHPQWAYSRPFIHLKPAGSGFGRSPTPPYGGGGGIDPETGLELEAQFMDGVDSHNWDAVGPKFAPFNRLQDNQAIRAVDFHPSGEVYAIGSNSRALRICAYPAEHELRHFEPGATLGAGDGLEPTGSEPPAKPPRVLFKFLQVHRGSIYCVSFNPSGQLLATGSNDQTVHIVKYNSITHNPDGEEFRLTMHNGTIRDLCFIDDSSGNGSSLLLSAGGGDNKIYVTDCDTITPFQSMQGHTQMVMALSHCGGASFVSGSYDRTVRFWDLRSRSCTSIVSAPPSSPLLGSNAEQRMAGSAGGGASGPGAPVCALRVDPSGRLLATGHTDSTCMLYDIRGAKIIQTFRPHDDEIRALSFSPKSYYLLTGGYDGRLVVSDLQGDLTQPLPSACVAESQDKIVQAKWHPADFTFVSTSADKSATLWSLPGEIRN